MGLNKNRAFRPSAFAIIGMGIGASEKMMMHHFLVSSMLTKTFSDQGIRYIDPHTADSQNIEMARLDEKVAETIKAKTSPGSMIIVSVAVHQIHLAVKIAEILSLNNQQDAIVIEPEPIKFQSYRNHEFNVKQSDYSPMDQHENFQRQQEKFRRKHYNAGKISTRKK